MHTRLSKLVLVLAFALYASLVAFGNLADYHSNFTLVAHVLMMDTTFPGNQGLWRAIHSPLIHHAVYGFIIGCEIIIAGLCWLGGFRLYQNIKIPPLLTRQKVGRFWVSHWAFCCGLPDS